MQEKILKILPNLRKPSLKAILSKIDNNTELLQRLRQYRNKRLAHFDSDLH